MYFRIAIFFRLLNAHHTSDQLIRYLIVIIYWKSYDY